jgi:hypothetical protein
MRYNTQVKRDEILATMEKKGYQFPKHDHKLISFVNLAISPSDWTQVYNSARTAEKIPFATWEAVKGAIMAMLVVSKRKSRESHRSCDAYVLPFIELMRSDMQGDSEKFLLNMRWYMPRFLFIVGLKEAFGIDWREFTFKHLRLKKKCQKKTYGSLLASNYPLRTLLYAYIVYKNYKQPGEVGYEKGVNDTTTLLEKESKHSYCHSYEHLLILFVALQETLPSSSYQIRRDSCYAIDKAINASEVFSRSYHENMISKEKLRNQST